MLPGLCLGPAAAPCRYYSRSIARQSITHASLRVSGAEALPEAVLSSRISARAIAETARCAQSAASSCSAAITLTDARGIAQQVRHDDARLRERDRVLSPNLVERSGSLIAADQSVRRRRADIRPGPRGKSAVVSEIRAVGRLYPELSPQMPPSR